MNDERAPARTQDLSFPNGARARVYITQDAPGLGGRLKERPDDFLVEELPLYHPAGSGEHLYLMIEKRDLSTFDAVDIVAEHFGVKSRSIGYAGLKDKHAITRQVLSVHAPGRGPADFPMLRHDRLSVLWVDQHTHKLRRGDLKGNRFSIRVRGVGLTAAVQATRQMERLSQVGLPNRFGPQRFGHLGNNHLVGLAIIQGDWQSVLDHLLGPSREHPLPQAEARAAYARGDFRAAHEAFPRLLRAERQALGVLASGGSPAKAVNAIEPRARLFYLSAFQSAVFNAVLDRRIDDGTWDTPMLGDIVMSHDDRSERSVNPATLDDECAACRGLAASPTGPMWGGRTPTADGKPHELELQVLAELGLTPKDIDAYARTPGVVFKGSRRPLRVPITDVQVEAGADAHGQYLRCAFDLPRGSFATVALDELMKNGAVDASAERAAASQAAARVSDEGDSA